MTIKCFHLGLRQVVMVLMSWAIDVPQELLQSDAKTGPLDYFIFTDPFQWNKALVLFLIKVDVNKIELISVTALLNIFRLGSR